MPLETRISTCLAAGNRSACLNASDCEWKIASPVLEEGATVGWDDPVWDPVFSGVGRRLQAEGLLTPALETAATSAEGKTTYRLNVELAEGV